MITHGLLTWFQGRIETLKDEHGAVAVGWLALGILLGAILVVFAIIKFLIPGE
jgi:hypothetical protein